MPAITYRATLTPSIIRVYLGRRLAGRIVAVKADGKVVGHRYVPEGSAPGATFKTIEEVKASIEGRVPA